MKITLPLFNPCVDDNNISEKTKKDLQNSTQVNIYRDCKECRIDDEALPYSCWLEYGEENQKSFIFDVRLEELELFAHTLLSDIKIFKKLHKDLIKKRIKNNIDI